MNIFEKYKLYRNIMKQKPNNLHNKKYVPKYAIPYAIREHIDYKTNDFNIYTNRYRLFNGHNTIKEILLMMHWVELPVSYSALITDKDQNILAEFKFFTAKRLFKHGKKYSK